MCRSDLDARFCGDYRELLSTQNAFLFISDILFILLYLLITLVLCLIYYSRNILFTLFHV